MVGRDGSLQGLETENSQRWPTMSDWQPMTVWVDGDLCSGCELCFEVAPTVFQPHSETGVSQVHLDGVPIDLATNQPQRVNEYELTGRTVEGAELVAAIKAVEQCPSEIINLQHSKQA